MGNPDDCCTKDCPILRLAILVIATFPNFSDLEQSFLYTFINHFHFDSVFNVENRIRQYFCMAYIDNACMHKFLHNSARFCKTQHVLYFQNAGGSRISNMTFPCVMKVMRISLLICITLHFSAFFCFLHLTERTVVLWTDFFSVTF